MIVPITNILTENSVKQFRQFQMRDIMEKHIKGFHNYTDSNIALQVLTIDLPHHLCMVGRKWGCGGQIRVKMSAQGGLMIILPRPQTRRCYCAN